MATVTSEVNGSGAGLSAAQRLAQQHAANPLQATVEDAHDDDPSSPTASATDVLKTKTTPTSLDTHSHDAFPELGASVSIGKGKGSVKVVPVWAAKKVNGAPKGHTARNGTVRPATSTLASLPALSTPVRSTGNVPSMSIPGRHVETYFLEPQHVLPKNQLRRPLPDLVRDLNRKSRAQLSTTAFGNGRVRIDAVGTQDQAQEAIRNLVQLIGTRNTVTLRIPSSARAFIIGKQGSTIKSIQEKTGARIHMPKTDDGPGLVDEDDDGDVDVQIEGNSITAAAAREAILKIVNERAASVTTKLKNIPAEFYPFIAGANNSNLQALESQHGVQIRVPSHKPWSSSFPEPSAQGGRPVFSPAGDDNPIQLAGDRAAVQAARAAIESRAQQLHNQLHVDQCQIQRGRQQFILGDRGIKADDFFADTNTVLLLPSDEDETVTVIGFEQDINRGLEKVSDLAFGPQQTSFNVTQLHKHAAGGNPTYARDIARYLNQRKEFERLQKVHQVYINTPFSEGVLSPWEFYARDQRNFLQAQKELRSIIGSHPPSRLATVQVDPFFHSYLRAGVKPRVEQDYGVYVVVPDLSEANLPVVLVFEGKSEPSHPYQVSQKVPSADDVDAFKQGLEEARNHILALIQKQGEIQSEQLECAVKFQEKLRVYIKREQEKTGKTDDGGIPVRVSVKGTVITMRGPKTAVAKLAAKARTFVEQEVQDDKERGFTLKFDFPEKYNSNLIGKNGSSINNLRQEFDVEIHLSNGAVELRGPKAKAEKAKAHILNLVRAWSDEVSHTLKIEPKYHGELIGAQGGQIVRLQTRYNVHINFPRVARPTKDDDAAADAGIDVGKMRRQQGVDEVTIRGPKKGADAARDEIFALYEWLKETGFTSTVSVQQKHLPILIGSRGSGMEEIRTETGAKIDYQGDRQGSPDALVEIQLKGTKSQVAAAKKLIEEKKLVLDDTITTTIDVDRKWHKLLIGPGGSNLHDLIAKAGGPEDRRLRARLVQFPRQDDAANLVKIEGRKDVVGKIVAAIRAIVAEHESHVTETVDVPVEKHRNLIGRLGETKRKLETEFGVTLEIPQQGSGQSGVKVTGKPEAVEKATAHLASLTKEQPSETIQVPRRLHNTITEQGAFIRKLRNEYKVSVDHAGHSVPVRSQPALTRAPNGATPLITDKEEQLVDAHSWNLVENVPTEEGDIPWVLRSSSAEKLELAKKAVASAIEQAGKNSSTGYLVLPDPSTYRYVVGQGGSKVNSIRKQSGCRINIPRAEMHDEAIEIIGSRSGAERARDLILEAVREGLSGRQQRD